MTYVSKNQSRRLFLRRAGATLAATGTPFAVNLMSLGSAAAQTGGHKALVCLYLNGGNDQSNLVVPLDADGYRSYASGRPTLALSSDTLLRTGLVSRGQALGLHPALVGIKALMDQQQCALVANVGTLSQPTTREAWNAGRAAVSVPSQLFSHNDQTSAWHTGVPDRKLTTGWMGRIGDLIAPSFNQGSNVSIAMSVAGNSILQAGSQTIQYHLTPEGAVRLSALSELNGSAAGAVALRRLITQPRSNPFQNELAAIASRAIQNESIVASALSSVPALGAFPDTALGRQLQIVARMIAAGPAMGQNRQTFFVQQNGYDFHEDLLNEQSARLSELNDAVVAFSQALKAMGLWDRVALFTASDFGRALQHNGRGADHGWGGHHFVMGGAVRGNRVYGQFPTVALGGAEDAGQGRLIPTTAVDEYVSTLALWFGVPKTNLQYVLPNIDRFGSSNLGFIG